MTTQPVEHERRTTATAGGPPGTIGGTWRRALYLHERRVPATPPEEAVAERNRQRLRRWTTTFGDESALAGALNCLGLTRPDLAEMLDAEAAASADAARPAWAHRALTTVFTVQEAAEDRLVTDETLGVLRVLGPLLRSYQRELRDETCTLVEDSPFRHRLAELPRLLLATWPVQAVTQAMLRTVVLELNVARIEGRLSQPTPEARFAAFAAALAEPAAAQAFWAEYPVLLRYLTTILEHWRRMSVEFAGRIVADLGELDATLAPERGLGELREVSFGSGDTHRRGRSVAMVRFAHGTVVYKPRDCDADEAWAEVVAWFNQAGVRYDLRTPKVVARSGYGWTEFVEHSSCTDAAEVSAFHWRLGALLALLYALRGTDMHAENVIACGAHPVLIDLEALLEPPRPVEPGALPLDPAAQLTSDSVLSVGLLPSRIVIRGAGAAVAFEVSAVAVPESQLSAVPVPVAVDQGTDAMRFANQRIPVGQLGASRPRLAGQLVDSVAFQPDLVEGFAATYRLIMRERITWLRPGGLLDRFADVPLRHIPRATSYYTLMLMDSLHPDRLRDAAERDRALARLARGANGSGTWERLVPYEAADLRVGDIPFFTFRPGSRHIWASDGQAIPDALAALPLQAARERLTAMSRHGLTVQSGLIQRTFEAVAATRDPAPRALALPDEPLSAAEAEAAALELARRLVRGAARNQDGLGWVALHMVEELHWQLGAAGADLYAGTSGIALFLSTVAARTGDADIVAAAEDLCDMLVRQGSRLAEASHNRSGGRDDGLLDGFGDVGVFGIVGGLLYYLAHAAVLHDRPDLADTAEGLLALLDLGIEQDRAFDIVSGSAGAILACLALREVRPGGDALRVAERAAARLLGQRGGYGGHQVWCTPMADQPMLGMSHGAAGIAYALGRLHAVAPRPEYVEAAEAAVRYESACFDRQTGNWPDFRHPDYGGAGIPLVAWCHGAPGVAASRLGLLQQALSPAGREVALLDLGRAETLLWPATFGPDRELLVSQGSNVLCHGDLGNLEVLLLAARRRGDDAGHRLCLRAARALVEGAREGDYLTGPISPAGVPGLMYGLAGVGYGLLRLSRMDETASVLLLEPPRARSGHGRSRPGATLDHE